MLDNTQMTLLDESQHYRDFVEKFKPKKTTDDCYTPDNVYEAIRDWVCKRYGVDPEKVVRPFWPGGDYERFDYSGGKVVIDNPPFSILSEICGTYQRNGIPFFLFAPYLTVFVGNIPGVCSIITGSAIEYENGASVNTSFRTNLDPALARTEPELARIIKEQNDINRKKTTKQLPKYEYPNEVLTSTMMGYMAKYGIDFEVYPESAYFVRTLESQKPSGKTIFGGGYLLSEKAAAEKAAAEKAAAEKAAAEKAAEKAAAERWSLSAHELEIIKWLGEREKGIR